MQQKRSPAGSRSLSSPRLFKNMGCKIIFLEQLQFLHPSRPVLGRDEYVQLSSSLGGCCIQAGLLLWLGLVFFGRKIVWWHNCNIKVKYGTEEEEREREREKKKERKGGEGGLEERN